MNNRRALAIFVVVPGIVLALLLGDGSGVWLSALCTSTSSRLWWHQREGSATITRC